MISSLGGSDVGVPQDSNQRDTFPSVHVSCASRPHINYNIADVSNLKKLLTELTKFLFDKNIQVLNRSFPAVIGLSLGTLLIGSQAKAVINLQVQQVGSDVVISGSGKANLSALQFISTELMYQNVLTYVQIYAGPNKLDAGQTNTGKVDLYAGVSSGPTTISSDEFLVELPDEDMLASNGDLFGIVTDPYTLVLPKGYISNTDLSGISTIRNRTISDLGLTAGLSTWTWGSKTDGTFDSINLIVPNNITPVPGPLPLAGAAVMFGWARKLRLRNKSLNRN